MPTETTNLARVGLGIQAGAEVAKGFDAPTSEGAERLVDVAKKIGEGCVRAEQGEREAAAGHLREAAAGLTALAYDLEQ